MMTIFGVEAKKMKPTQKHRIALYEGILGTVYAVNKNREVKYFDYDYASAIEFSGLDEEDLRIYKTDRGYNFGTYYEPIGVSKGQTVIWTKEED